MSRERVGIKNTIHKTNFVELFDRFNSADSHHMDCDSMQGTSNLSIDWSWIVSRALNIAKTDH